MFHLVVEKNVEEKRRTRWGFVGREVMKRGGEGGVDRAGCHVAVRLFDDFIPNWGFFMVQWGFSGSEGAFSCSEDFSWLTWGGMIGSFTFDFSWLTCSCLIR